ncbi:MAG: N-acetyltransferase [Asticcacaulis sp.]
MSIRDIDPADYDHVNALWESVWWPTRSLAGWAWLAANPLLAHRPAPLGWVHVNETGQVDAVLGALPQRFWVGDSCFYGLTGHSLVVAPQVRGASRHMIKRIIDQPGFCARYTLNANILSHKIYGRFGFVSHPVETANFKLAWMIDPLACLAGKVLRRALEPHPTLARRAGERLMPGRLWHEMKRSYRHPIHEMTAFDEAYQDFWLRLRAEGDLIADRSAEVQTWRMKDPDQTVTPIVLKFCRGDDITGYACAMFSKPSPIEPLVLEIIDLMALQDEAEAVPALMADLMQMAHAHGAAKLRLSMVSPRLLKQLGSYADKARREGGWAHAHIHLDADAPDIHRWSPTSYDGDLFMSLRPPPRRYQITKMAAE